MGYQVLVAVILGIVLGLFLGPLCSIFIPIAMAFTMLLKMVALPYICFSLIHGLGSLSKETGKKLFLCAWPYFFILWGLTFLVMFLISLLIPNSDPVIIQAHIPDPGLTLTKTLLKYLIPENPFYDLANNIVPAIAIFGLISGTALMALKNKEPFVGILEQSIQIMEKILSWIARISPIGAFAHIAVAFGMVYFEDLYKLEFYVVSFIVFSLFMTFWILPLLISNLTNIHYKDVLKIFREVCLLPFVTGIPTIVLPFLSQYIRKLSQERAESSDQKFHETSQTILPLSYSFGQIGNSIVLFFITFCAFYYRNPLEFSEKIDLGLLSLPLTLGSTPATVNSVSFLVEYFSFSSAAIELFMDTAAITTNFQVLMSVAGILTLLILSIYAYYGQVKIQLRTLLTRLGSSLLFFTIFILSIKTFIQFKDNYQDLYLSRSVSEIMPDVPKAEIFTSDQNGERGEEAPFERILNTRVLRVGYNTDSIPYCYWNKDRDLAGYDMAYAYALADDLDCRLEFVPLHFDIISEQLNRGEYDIGMCSLLMTEQRIIDMDFSHPYMEENSVLVVPIKNKSKFLDLETVLSMKDLKIGAGGANANQAQRQFPNAEVKEVSNVGDKMKEGEFDAFFDSESFAFAWCVLNPGYVVIDFQGRIGKNYYSYAIRTDSFNLASFLKSWLILKEESGFRKEMIDYWIKGKSFQKRAPRWSILNNVF